VRVFICWTTEEILQLVCDALCGLPPQSPLHKQVEELLRAQLGAQDVQVPTVFTWDPEEPEAFVRTTVPATSPQTLPQTEVAEVAEVTEGTTETAIPVVFEDESIVFDPAMLPPGADIAALNSKAPAPFGSRK